MLAVCWRAGAMVPEIETVHPVGSIILVGEDGQQVLLPPPPKVGSGSDDTGDWRLVADSTGIHWERWSDGWWKGHRLLKDAVTKLLKEETP